jgi:hypothetical protein
MTAGAAINGTVIVEGVLSGSVVAVGEHSAQGPQNMLRVRVHAGTVNSISSISRIE